MVKTLNNKNKVTIDRRTYEDLKRKAQILEEVLDFVPEKVFPIEIYTEKRIKEFLSEDKKEQNCNFVYSECMTFSKLLNYDIIMLLRHKIMKT